MTPPKRGGTLQEMGKILLAARGVQLSEADPSKTTFVKRHLDKLEDDYHVELTYKHQGKLHATKEADKFYQHARRIVDEYHNIRRKEPQEHVYISTIDIGAHFWIPEALADDENEPILERQDNKNVSLHIQVREWWEVLRDLRSGIADFGIATEIPDDSLHHKPLIDSPHCLFARADHDLTKTETEQLSLPDLEGHTVVCMHTASGPIAIEYQLRALNIKARIVTVDTASQVYSWINRGIGVGFLPECMVPDQKRFPKLPITHTLINASDTLYRRFQSVEKNEEEARQDVPPEPEELSPAAETIYTAIKNYWAGPE